MPNGIEILSAVLSAIGVGLTARRSLWSWPVSLIATLLYSWVFWRARLYADVALQGVFCLGIGYGWFLWARDRRTVALTPTNHTESLPARPLSIRTALIGAGLSILLAWGWSIALQRWSDDPTPVLDASLSSASLLAQLWTARRHRASWLLWAVIDLVYTGLFITRALYPTALLYGFFIALALYGYTTWRPRQNAA
ncbi:nicotinamide riboside transporter PnuC [Saccharibacter floricola]|uniref:nicotinamide riboside transporter PnuC n=1 Tax=Saccharibacter floricola TaxID=231053 RepID=UPI0003646F3C|nr:nicotinamide riboside transporter PnuC [Saccharibacter floricola]